MDTARTEGRRARHAWPDGVDLPPITMPALTTPDPVALANGLAALARAGVQHVALEASSHGLEQNRLDGLHLSAAGFTNLTRDHLDYHGTVEAYREAKLKLFADLLPSGRIAAANADMDSVTLDALRAIARTRNLTLRTVGEAGETIRLITHTPSPPVRNWCWMWAGRNTRSRSLCRAGFRWITPCWPQPLPRRMMPH